MLKHTSLHPLSRNNDDLLLHGRHHYVQLDPSLAASAKKRFPPLSPAALRKVPSAPALHAALCQPAQALPSAGPPRRHSPGG